MATPTLSTQAANQANNYEDVFNRQKAYFATNVTKSYEWRVDQLNLLARLLSEHTNQFYGRRWSWRFQDTIVRKSF